MRPRASARRRRSRAVLVLTGLVALAALLVPAGALLLGDDTPAASPSPSPVAGPTPPLTTPHPGDLAGVTTQPWTRVVVVDDRTLDLYYSADASGCTVLGNVRVAETPAAVTITVYVGAPDTRPRTCVGSGVLARTRVPLTAPLGTRTVLDGGALRSPEPRPVESP